MLDKLLIINRGRVRLFGIVILMSASPLAWCYQFSPTEIQFHLSAPYCKARFSAPDLLGLSNSYVRVPPGEVQRWQNIIGDVWRHMHHYCYGAVILSEALSARDIDPTVSPERRRVLLKDRFALAAGEMNYTISKDDQRNPLWGIMRVKQARAYEGAGNRDKALELLASVINRQPTNAEAYVAIGQTYSRAGDLRAAIGALEAGANRAKDKKAIYFYLAQYNFTLGNVDAARSFTEKAEREGLEMTRMRQRLDGVQPSNQN